MTSVFNTVDIFEFDVQSCSPKSMFGSAGAPYLYHPSAGAISLKAFNFSHFQVVDMEWETTNDIELRDVVPSDAISINFMLEGTIDSRFRGLEYDLNMRARTHNLIHAPEAGHINYMKGGQRMTNLLLGIDKAFFASAIGADDSWSERILSDLEHGRPFSGMRGTPTITPQMLYLIDDIRHSKATGPMRNLLIQSRVLELIALQIEQFRNPTGISEQIPPNEIEKLLQLRAYLDANFLTEHSLAQLSRYCLLNEFKVKKGFKLLFDTTVFNYLRKLRMDHAGQLLRNSALSVDEVADRLGYEHAQHFSIAFKKYTGLTPSHYQQGKSLAA
ncbi:AraC family transcriptional regulator [Spirosoma daeguense]